ncbi:TonB-dependent receptor domain-containing protein [Candidatus Cloacimonadota bacterium]
MKKYQFLIVLLLLGYSAFSATISGFISNAANGEAIPYSSAILKGTTLGGLCNSEGYFVINNVPQGKAVLVVSNTAFEKKTIELEIISAEDDQFFRLELEKKTILMEGVQVTEKKKKREINSREIIVSSELQTTDEILEIPQVGDPDVFRAIQVLPGVTSISDFSSGLYVRGGSHDQNLILLDETDVYNPNHFGGIFSTFNTDAVESVELLKGGFPARYGGRLSSVMNVTNRDGNRKHHQGVARISLITSSATIEGPWKLGIQTGSYMASFRRTYLELMDKLAPSMDLPDYYFYDGHAKVNWDISQKDKITTSTYFGKDKLDLDFGSKLLISWGNETYTSQWVHIFNPQVFSKFIIAGSHFGSLFNIKSDADEEFNRRNDIYDLTFKGILNYIPNDEHKIDFGYDLKYNDVRYKVSAENSDIDQSGFADVKINSFNASFFLQDSWDFHADWTLQPGLRVTNFTAESDNLPASPKANYTRFSPRLSLRFRTGELSNISFSYGKYHQYLSSLNTGESSPIELWFPLDGSVEPGESEHYILGYKTQLGDYLAIDLEAYYKDYKNLLEYRIETDEDWNNETGKLADIYNMGPGYSYGSDFMLRTDWNGIEGFIGYSLGFTKRKLDDVNIDPETGDEQEFFPRYDRTHQVNIVENFNFTSLTGKTILGHEFNIGTTFSISTGQPYAKPEQFIYNDGNFDILYSYSDRIRLPNYSRFDINFRFKKSFRAITLEYYVQIINLFNYENVQSRGYTYELEDDGEITVKEEDVTMFPFIPFLGFNIEW